MDLSIIQYFAINFITTDSYKIVLADQGVRVAGSECWSTVHSKYHGRMSSATCYDNSASVETKKCDITNPFYCLQMYTSNVLI